jgi:hypothetical protein
LPLVVRVATVPSPVASLEFGPMLRTAVPVALTPYAKVSELLAPMFTSPVPPTVRE